MAPRPEFDTYVLEYNKIFLSNQLKFRLQVYKCCLKCLKCLKVLRVSFNTEAFSRHFDKLHECKEV